MKMSVKAKLSVVLKADDVTVAEMDDAVLWQRVLTAINMGTHDLGSVGAASKEQDQFEKSLNDDGVAKDDKVAIFATWVGVSKEVLMGAISPNAEAPYLHLDQHCWEEMKKQLPARGTLAIPPLGLAATLLTAWAQKALLGSVTQADCQAVLGTIGLRDNNATRSISNSEWLQSRSGGQVQLNPASISTAIKICKCFCEKNWSAWKQGA